MVLPLHVRALPLRFSEVSQDEMCVTFYQLVLWRCDQPVRFDRPITPSLVQPILCFDKRNDIYQ